MPSAWWRGGPIDPFLWAKVNNSFRWWFSVQRAANLGGWMRNTYILGELERIASSAAAPVLLRPWETLMGWEAGDPERGKLAQLAASRRRFVRRVYRRYGQEIWSACFRAARASTRGTDVWIAALAELPGAGQVIEPIAFEELLVCHALRQVARECLARAAS